MKNDPKKIAKKMGIAIRNERRRQGLTGNELAKLAGVGRMRVSEIERGNFIRIMTVIRIAEALGLELDPSLTDYE